MRLNSLLLATVTICFAPMSIGACNKVKWEIGATPRYPCEGETVTFTYDVHGVDRARVRDADNVTWLDTTGDFNGAFHVTDIKPSMVPFTAKAWRKNKTGGGQIPNEDFPFSVLSAENATPIAPLKVHGHIPDHSGEVDTGTTIGCNCVYSGGTETCESYLPIVNTYDFDSGAAGPPSTGVPC